VGTPFGSWVDGREVGSGGQGRSKEGGDGGSGIDGGSSANGPNDVVFADQAQKGTSLDGSDRLCRQAASPLEVKNNRREYRVGDGSVPVFKCSRDVRLLCLHQGNRMDRTVDATGNQFSLSFAGAATWLPTEIIIISPPFPDT